MEIYPLTYNKKDGTPLAQMKKEHAEDVYIKNQFLKQQARFCYRKMNRSDQEHFCII